MLDTIIAGLTSVGPKQWAIVFILAILVDIAWSLYIRRAGQGRPVSSANWACLIILFGVFNTLSWLENKWVLVPLIIGSWAGTWAIVKWDHRNDKKKVIQGKPTSFEIGDVRIVAGTNLESGTPVYLKAGKVYSVDSVPADS